jgi:hypothetical protein
MLCNEFVLTLKSASRPHPSTVPLLTLASPNPPRGTSTLAGGTGPTQRSKWPREPITKSTTDLDRRRCDIAMVRFLLGLSAVRGGFLRGAFGRMLPGGRAELLQQAALLARQAGPKSVAALAAAVSWTPSRSAGASTTVISSASLMPRQR